MYSSSFSNQIQDLKVINYAMREAVVFQIAGPSVIMNASLAPAFHW